ncbi:acyltransferase [Chitinophaga pendula]|uniref:acyltransferase family protein n=1 Tax=Chitinophaga TaxID=79328 RepID=UPI000BB0ACC4|nr:MULTISPECIES: acyltransferase [Chitinophaga]ASZ13482.1 acyltransferase [Chitinophaga sp. MD30]UCJ08891.1 acyltransferase [Chitinophaga pendula]
MTRISNPSIPEHFYSLDAIRGFAAIIVVLYHWQLFFFKDDIFILNGYDKAALPLHDLLAVCYNNGMVVVDMFFLLSGFIFFWLYAARIAEKRISVSKFFLFRISRLYPIHILTFLMMIVLQWLMMQTYGHYFIIQLNDYYHFVLNIFFIQTWGFEKGPSFNGPSWSVSVEVFLYVVFFLICRLKWQSNKLLLLLLIPLGAVLQHYDLLIGKGLFSFFLGALVYYVYSWIIQRNRFGKYFTPILLLTCTLWILVVVEYHGGFLRTFYIDKIKELRPGISDTAAQTSYGVVRNLFFRVTVSPCTILLLALWETGKGTLSRHWAWIGNSSYAIYLLHFPLQIMFVLVAHQLGLSRSIMSHPLTLLLFFGILIPLSVLTYYYFELPVQDKMRGALRRKEKAALA